MKGKQIPYAEALGQLALGKQVYIRDTLYKLIGNGLYYSDGCGWVSSKLEVDELLVANCHESVVEYKKGKELKASEALRRLENGEWVYVNQSIIRIEGKRMLKKVDDLWLSYEFLSPFWNYEFYEVEQ